MKSKSSAIPGPARLAGERSPFLWAAAAFAGGISTSFYCWRPASWWVASGAAFVLLSIFFIRRRAWAAWGLALCGLFAAGALLVQVRGGGSDSEILRYADGAEVTVTAHVTEGEDLPAHGKAETRQLVDVETEEITRQGSAVSVHAGMRLSIYSQENAASHRVFRYGERLRFPAKLFAPRNFRNPGAFDYAGYLAGKGIVVLASTKAESVEVLPGLVGSRAQFLRSSVHRSIIERIHWLWPENQAALVNAMVMGEDAFIDRGVRNDFQRSGTYHVLVVSGMNVGILAFVVFWMLRRIHASDLLSSVVVVLLSIGYAFLTDVGAPIWRATLMLVLYLGVRLVYRERSMLNAVGAAALGLLVADPMALFGASFQLTFLSVLLIAAVGVPLLERTLQPYARGLRYLDSTSFDRTLPPPVTQLRVDLRMVAERLEAFKATPKEENQQTSPRKKHIPLRVLGLVSRTLLSGCEILVISGLMQVGLALPMAYYFHRATVVGLPANMLVVPLTGVLMPAAVLAVGLGYVSPTLAILPARVAGFALDGITGAVQRLGGLHVADTRVATPEVLVTLSGLAALAFCMIVGRRRAWLAGAGLATLACSAIWVSAIPPRPEIRPGVLEVTSIDVGQGDSTLLVLPDGRTLLVDAGGLPNWMHSEFDIGENVVSPYLWARRIQRLDAVVVTHAHADHMGGMSAILGNFRPKELWMGADLPSADLHRLLQKARELQIPVITRRAGDDFQFGGVSIRILAPSVDPETHLWRANDDCLVMQVSYGKTSALLEGDAEPQVERRIANAGVRADLLRVAHHGSARATSPALLAALRPQYGVISVGARNVYGHPRMEVLTRLAQAEVKTYRTDLDGAVTFYLDGTSVSPVLAALH